MKYILTILMIFVSITIFAQKRILNGFVLDSFSYAPLKNAHITNLTNNKSINTDDRGRFSISVSANDVLFFTADGYHFHTLRNNVLLEDTVYVYLSVLPHVLPGVTVQTSGYTKYQRDSIKRLNDFNEDLIAKPYSSVTKAHSQGFGLGISLDFLSSREKSKRKSIKRFNEHEKDAYVSYRFSRDLVAGYTSLTGDTLTHFLQLYTPEYEWLRIHTTDEDILYYINDKLKLFLKRNDK